MTDPEQRSCKLVSVPPDWTRDCKLVSVSPDRTSVQRDIKKLSVSNKCCKLSCCKSCTCYKRAATEEMCMSRCQCQ